MQCTVRIGGRNSSVKIKDNLLALWYILSFPDEEISYRNVQKEVRRFVSKCLVGYRPNNPYYIGNKGITDFVNSCIIQEVLERPERIKYKRCLKMLSKSLFKDAALGDLESLESVERSASADLESIEKQDIQ